MTDPDDYEVDEEFGVPTEPDEDIDWDEVDIYK